MSEPEQEQPAVELTGHDEIDRALARLEDLPGLDVVEHPAQFDAIHGVLREVLAGAGREDVAGAE